MRTQIRRANEKPGAASMRAPSAQHQHVAGRRLTQKHMSSMHTPALITARKTGTADWHMQMATITSLTHYPVLHIQEMGIISIQFIREHTTLPSDIGILFLA